MPRRDRKRVDLAGFFARRGRWIAIGLAAACLTGAAFSAATGCSGWDPTSPFERNAPAVDQAIRDLDAGNLESAAQALESYLGTGACSDAGIGLPDSVRQKPNGSFDLGLTLFHLAERYGHRFGDEGLADGGPEQEQSDALRGIEIDCALVLVKAIGADPSVPADLRARARYLSGNLEFLRRKYEDAVTYYDQALAIIPGVLEEAGGDGVGRDAAWNRAIALRRIEDQKDAAPPDAEPDAPPDAEPDAPPDAEPDAGDDGGDQDAGNDGGEPDAGDDGGGQDAGNDGGDQDQSPDAGPQDQAPDAGSPEQPEPPREQPQEPPQTGRQDDRILDQLEEAPTYQEQEAKNKAGMRRGRGMEDK
ncbi:tetratricopeptide repeat protein [Sorangium atrum]|uniref:Tetratricopeptide repeat protein n=1 Tax=Sorangium atrum TaxID=2995308 RepID=A0ABT5BWV5_9BACT|nr:tetratricopeptide repeat protein [Sorangium aterium]MDC0678613.1 tetratricopeptide repeat protein [Sorangium aterium]